MVDTHILETLVFDTTVSRDRFLRICTFLHFSYNLTAYSIEHRLIKVPEILDYFINKFKCIEFIIRWRGKPIELKTSITHNPDKIVTYDILNRMIWESKTDYICNFILFCGKRVSLENVISKLLNPYLSKWYHIVTKMKTVYYRLTLQNDKQNLR